tara:strand:+ start:2835 stop:3872 length:1038 start_codon:yes stop_codon:yes gene_type:complete
MIPLDWQLLMQAENQILTMDRTKAIDYAWSDRGVPYEWETSNAYWRSMLPKLKDYLEYCCTGIDPRNDKCELKRAPPTPKTKPGKPNEKLENRMRTVGVVKNKKVKMKGLHYSGQPFTNKKDDTELASSSDEEGCKYEKFAHAHAHASTVAATTITPAEARAAGATKASTNAHLKKPKVPDIDVQEARILFRNSSLVKYLRQHPLGDWVKNPQRRVAGKHTQLKTKDRAADSIKSIVRDWFLTTTQGKRALAAAEISEGELSIDRLIPRNAKNGMGLNCIFNLYAMPTRHNTQFGDVFSHEKRTYVGERAYMLAKGAHDAFVRDVEADYDWDVGFVKRAIVITGA